MRAPHSRSGYWPLTTGFLVSLGIMVARGWRALDRVPSDPGYVHVQDWRRLGVRSFVVPEHEYLDLVPRLVAPITSVFPIAAHAVVQSVLVHVIWSACAVIVGAILVRLTQSRVVGVLAGLAVLLNPSAMESGVGNLGNTKWVLSIAAIVGGTVGLRVALSPRLLGSLIVIAGLSNPIMTVGLLPALASSTFHAPDRARKHVVFCASGGVVVVQLAVLLAGGLELGGRSADRTMLPWEGMGLFWWMGLTAPLGGAIAFVIVHSGLGLRTERVAVAGELSLGSMLLGLTSYLIGGIADRYFVAPMALSMISVVVLAEATWSHRPRLRPAAVVAGVLVLVPVVKWCEAGWFLTTGPEWSTEIVRARDLCADDNRIEVELAVSPAGTEVIPCPWIRG